MILLTSEEATADGGYNHLGREQARHEREYRAGLVINGVDTDDMDGGADGEKDCGTNGFKEVEV